MFAYHHIPVDIKGKRLLPLNLLKSVHPELYAVYSDKYSWRQAIMQTKIPGLKCLWNDVIHLSLIHPKKILAKVLSASPESAQSYPNRKFFAVPLASMDPKKTVIYDCPTPALDPKTYTASNQADAHSIEVSRIHSIGEGANLDQKSRLNDFERYCSFEFQHGRRPLLFNGLPHVLTKGPISISGLEIVDWLD